MDNAPTITIPTRQQAKERRAAEQRGFYFPLPRTGGHAHVRRLSMANLATLGGLPTTMQNAVLKVFREFQEENSDAPLTWDRLSRNQKRQEEMANTLCIAGFINPSLYPTPQEADLACGQGENAMCVTDLHIDERIRYLNLCMSQDDDAAFRLVPFPAPGLGRVETVPAGEDAPTPVPVAGSA